MSPNGRNFLLNIDIFYINVFLGFIPFSIALSYFHRQKLPMKMLVLSIVVSVLVEALAAYLDTFTQIKNTLSYNLYAIVSAFFIGAAYCLKVKDDSPKLGYLFVALAGLLILYHSLIHLRFGINTLQPAMYLSSCAYFILVSLFYFFYVVIISEELDLLKDAFFLITAGIFILYMVNIIVLYSNHVLEQIEFDGLFRFKHLVYTFYLILLTFTFLIDRKKTLNA